MVKYILENAIEEGKLKPGMRIIEASSGNTGSALALITSMLGYKCTIITNDKCSSEKQTTVKSFGAELIVVPKGVN